MAKSCRNLCLAYSNGCKIENSIYILWRVSGYIGQGRWDKLKEQKFVDRNWVEEHSGMIGLRLNDILDFNKSLKKEDVSAYIYPSEDELSKNKIYPYFTGTFFNWDIAKILPIIKFGWKVLMTKSKETMEIGKILIVDLCQFIIILNMWNMVMRELPTMFVVKSDMDG